MKVCGREDQSDAFCTTHRYTGKGFAILLSLSLVVFAICVSDTLHALEPCIAYRYGVADVG